MTQPNPDGYPLLCPSLTVSDADAAIDFYVELFGATERVRLVMPDGRVGHAEISLGDGAVVMLNDEFPDVPALAPTTVGGTSVAMNLYVSDVDAVFAKAIELGASALREPADQFYGDRTGQFFDPWGHRWSVQTRLEDVSDEEMQRRINEMG